MVNEINKEVKVSCLRLLARREHSRKELLNKVMTKGYSRETIENVVSELAEQGLQNDQRFMESYARQRIAKGYGPVRIKYELQQKGIEDCNLDSVVKESAGSWAEQLIDIYTRKYNEANSITRKEWAKRSRFLQQRGFSGEMIMNLFKQLAIGFE
jgi:regulatory protein